jgi:hypothetical protein
MNTKKNVECTTKQKAKAIFEIVRKVGDGLTQQYDELAVAKRVKRKQA